MQHTSGADESGRAPPELSDLVRHKFEAFTYPPIDLDRRAIRLFRLHCAAETEVLSGDLFDAYFEDRENMIPFEALSYTWGGTELTHSLSINGARLPITYNLHLALQHVRQWHQDRYLWIDAICINQGNDKERGHQVAQMGSIYKAAQCVVCWLGPATDETDAAMEFLQLIQRESLGNDRPRCSRQWAELRSVAQAVDQSNLRRSQRQGLAALLQREWFKRVWIIQEVANAQTAQV
ncbi:hypothetical protein XA68_13754 [Ophiocordyceps unilateralis]|uniref:Heterokaryon incompatibility domain-containing protein n=1 Tax=Ophiocordyceps unilateralis TaxID=268505 RepID=A0A2A9PAD0_OPHUN|nr:hypothetical protein XA68_13754 [Ophiocordyceps unilateralis]